MSKVIACPVPEESLLAGFGDAGDYRDSFARDVPGEVTLAELIERFYCSPAFRPERVVLGLIGHGASNEDARRLARGEANGIAVWKVVERREREILLDAPSTGTASWLAVEPLEKGTRLKFGTWVGNIDRSGWRAMQFAHEVYSKVLLGSL